MGKFILKLTNETAGVDYYLEWSTVVDAPVSPGLPLDEFKKYYQREYGESGMLKLPERLARVEKSGSSGFPPHDKVDDFFQYNHAGKGGKTLDKDGVIREYCYDSIEDA